MIFKLTPDPTFRAEVKLKLHGKTYPLVMEFKHRTKDELDRWVKDEKTSGLDNVDFVMEMAVGWHDVDEPWSREAVSKLCQNFISAPTSIREAYFGGLVGAQLGN